MDLPELSVGRELPPLEVAIDRADLIRYAAGSGDLFYVHWDQDRVRALGYPDVVVHGWLSFAHMMRAVNAWLPAELADVLAYSVRYRRPTYPGTMTCGGRVVSLEGEAAGQVVGLELWAKDASGETLTAATATLRVLPVAA